MDFCPYGRIGDDGNMFIFSDINGIPKYPTKSDLVISMKQKSTKLIRNNKDPFLGSFMSPIMENFFSFSEAEEIEETEHAFNRLESHPWEKALILEKNLYEEISGGELLSEDPRFERAILRADDMISRHPKDFFTFKEKLFDDVGVYIFDKASVYIVEYTINIQSLIEGDIKISLEHIGRANSYPATFLVKKKDLQSLKHEVTIYPSDKDSINQLVEFANNSDNEKLKEIALELSVSLL